MTRSICILIVKGIIVESHLQANVGPVHMYPLLETIYFFVIRFIGFVLFSPVWPIVHSYPAVTTVTENASFQNAFQSADFWLLLILVYVWTDENGGFRILYHDVIHHIPRELCMLSKGVLSYFHRFLNWVDERKLWIRYMWKRIFRGAGIKFPFSKTHSFFFLSEYIL